MLTFGSVCSGIEAASVAWEPLGWRSRFFSEIEKFPSAVLAHHYGSNMPDEGLNPAIALGAKGNGVPNYGDMSNFEEWPDHHASGSLGIDILVGGTPCQSYSVAGLRKGLDDQRGNLMLTYGAIARRFRPFWVVWENVPGVLSSDGGRDFASLLGLLSGRRITVPPGGWRSAGIVEGFRGKQGGAYGLAWRVIDAQFIRVDGFGRAVPQRRRRVFVVGYFGDWRRAAAVLFERESLSGYPAPRRQAGEGFAAFAESSLGDYRETDTSGTLKASGGVLGGGSETFIAFSGCDWGGDAQLGVTPTLRVGSGKKLGGGQQLAVSYVAQEVADTLTVGANQTTGFPSGEVVARGGTVRRLTPMECERLQGFPDAYTLIPIGKKTAADGPRYKALGNSMAINAMRWLGVRIQKVQDLINSGEI